MYNTVLGAKPLRSDGSTFYYADFNNQGSKFYCDHLWPCCSGTLPLVATDYRINTYLRDPRGVYVNLYIPSTLTWMQDGARVSLQQSSAYPFDSHIAFKLTATKQQEFAIKLRITRLGG